MGKFIYLHLNRSIKMDSNLNYISEHWQTVASILAILSAIWVTIGKNIRDGVLTFLKIKSEKLTIEQRYDKFIESRIEKLLNTISHYEGITDNLEKVAEDRLLIIEDYKAKNKTLNLQLKEQEYIIERYKAIIEDDRSQLKKADAILRKFKVYIKQLEGLLIENQVDFNKIDTTYPPFNK